MAGFLLPLFLALLLVVIFGPMHGWFQKKCGRHDRIAALLTTGSILLLVLIPLGLMAVEAAYDAQSVYRDATSSPEPDRPGAGGRLETSGGRIRPDRAFALEHRKNWSISAATWA